MTLSILVAVFLDHWLGEPKKYHPLVVFGNFAIALENQLNKKTHLALQQKIMGSIAMMVLITPFVIIIYTLEQLLKFNTFYSSVILYLCIASNSLKQHTQSVFQALEGGTTGVAKNRVAMIVSRDTSKMTVNEIRKATIESILENGSDAIFAPIFWFIIAGPEGVVVYRLTNTLDAMWGYKNQKFLYFGRAAARFDDVLNWVPARLTALSYALLGQTRNALHCWKTQAFLLESPNAGPVMTSGAGSLNLQLGGPASYHGKIKDKVYFGTQNMPADKDIVRANLLITNTLVLWLIVIIVIALIGEEFA